MPSFPPGPSGEGVGISNSGRLVILGRNRQPARTTTHRTLDRAYDARYPFKSLLLLYGLRWWQWAGVYTLFLLKNLPVWLTPAAVAMTIAILDPATPYGLNDLWLVWGYLLGALALNIPTHVWYMSHVSRCNRGVEQRLRAALVRRLQQLSIAFHNDSESGRIQAKVLRDVEQVEQFGNQFMQMGLQALTMIAVSLAITTVRDPWLALFYVVATPICILLVAVFRARIRRYNRDYRQSVEVMTARVGEMIDMIPVTRAHGIESHAIAMIEERLETVRSKGYRLDIYNALFQSSTWVTLQVTQLVSLVVTGLMCWHGHLTVPDVVLYQALFAQMIMAVNMLLSMYPQLARGMESMRSLGEVLECPDLERNIGKRSVSSVAGAVEFQEVGFTYRNRQDPALMNLSFQAQPGQCVALVGESGSGKSTAMNLLIGFLRPTSGRILLDGQDMEELDMRTFRRSVAVVSQHVMLFGGTLKENITYGLEEVEDAQVEAVIHAANLQDVVAGLPQGLDTPLGEHGVQLSGGQRQRIAIARALIRDPQIIILDEATSALDVISERLVQEAIDRLITGRSTFIVAHRLSTIRNADLVLVMRGGRCVEQGTQEELMALGGEFSRLKSLQH
ncbi:MAG: ABC transporter ATP-binding protein [Planctomycetota bacterium]|nr:MAG: ABC transporter ATP-binding protein [Planctomycetota bacterium]